MPLHGGSSNTQRPTICTNCSCWLGMGCHAFLMLLQHVYSLQNSELLMFCCYVWPNPNHSELLIGSICNLSPNRHCFLYYFLICHYTYQYLSLLKGQELEISFSLFSVYFGVGVMTLWESFSYLIEEGGGPPHPAICAEQGGFYLLRLSQNEPSTVGVHWGIWAHEDTANVLQQAVVNFFTDYLKMDYFWGMKGSHHWLQYMTLSLP